MPVGAVTFPRKTVLFLPLVGWGCWVYLGKRVDVRAQDFWLPIATRMPDVTRTRLLPPQNMRSNYGTPLAFMTAKTRATRFHIDSTERLPSGALLVRGNLTKTGVFNYQFGEDTVRELRSEEEIFASETLDSLLGAPVTIDHPAAFVDNTNHAVLSVGVVRKVDRADPYVAGEMRIHDQRTIDMIQAKRLAEVSLGYATDVVPHTDSAIADMAQTNIVYNHAALGPSGWGRLGSDVALTLDSNGDLDFSAFRMDAEVDAFAAALERYNELLKRL